MQINKIIQKVNGEAAFPDLNNPQLSLRGLEAYLFNLSTLIILHSTA